MWYIGSPLVLLGFPALKLSEPATSWTQTDHDKVNRPEPSKGATQPEVGLHQPNVMTSGRSSIEFPIVY